jgi:glycosyltransferase involved in cell wall biosynthesis
VVLQSKLRQIQAKFLTQHPSSLLVIVKGFCSFVDDNQESMRILIVHTFYQDPGGEDVVFEQEKRLLAQDHTVTEFIAHNQKGFLGGIQTALSPWNYKASQGFEKVIRQFRPDIIHIHNLHYALGPWLIRTAHKCGVPVVHTLHNYRYLCPSATLFAQDQLFTNSLRQDFPWTAVQKGVHSQSKLKTFWLAFTQYFHRKLGTFQMVGRYIALTPFAKDLFLQSTFPISSEQMVVKPNFVYDVPQKKADRQKHFLFVGRLSDEKGIAVLLKAFAESPFQLKIAGNGPWADRVRSAAQRYSNIQYLGALNREQIQEEMSICSALIFPSIWFEGMPMTLLEAFASGTPVIGSRMGAMQTMINHEQTGLLFETGNAVALRKAIQFWSNLSDEKKAEMAQKCRDNYLEHYTPEKNLQALLTIYHSLIKTSTNASKA